MLLSFVRSTNHNGRHDRPKHVTMIPNLPTYISVVFGLTVLATLLFFYRAIQTANRPSVQKSAAPILLGLLVWLVIQAVLPLNGVYKLVPVSGPPKLILFGILPAMATVIWLSATPKGRRFTDSLSLAKMTWLNTFRIVVELVLYWLFLHKAVPQLITFEGRNFDILAGLTAPFIAYFGLTKGKLSRQLILLWNVVCLGLLLNIIVNALLSAPSPFQQFAFEQPNRALANFPFSWLPTFIVPLVLLGHITAIRRLWKRTAV